MFVRDRLDPILSPSDVRPFTPGCRILGVFNPGVTVFAGEPLLLVRVAETPVTTGAVRALWVHPDSGSAEVVAFADDDHPDLSDSRLIRTRRGTFLTSLSHLRVARPEASGRWRVEDQPALFPQGPYESFGIEDARITLVGGRYYITYSAVSEWGICTALAVTDDFQKFERLGNLFPPDNKDVVLFPERIGGRWWALHRPSCSHFGLPDIWSAQSDNLLDWGHHRRLIGPRPGLWDGARVGASCVPIATPEGWLVIYHGATPEHRYAVGALLLDAQDPNVVLGRSLTPVLEPETPAETAGFFPGVVFPCGALVTGDAITLYYGASDDSIAVARGSLSSILKGLILDRPLEQLKDRRQV